MVKLSRRNVLIGAGTIVAGGGAALGTGAFSSVEASRDVSVETSGDAGAIVAFEIVSAELRGDGDGANDDGTIEFDTENDLNVDAVTTFDAAFQITNNRDNSEGGPINVNIRDDDSTPNELIIESGSGDSSNMYFRAPDGVVVTDDSVEIPAGSENSVTFDVVFNLEGEMNTSDGNDAIPEAITIVANDTE